MLDIAAVLKFPQSIGARSNERATVVANKTLKIDYVSSQNFQSKIEFPPLPICWSRRFALQMRIVNLSITSRL